MRKFLGPFSLAEVVRFAAARSSSDHHEARSTRGLLLLIAAFALIPAFAAGQVPIGSGPFAVPPLNANLYGVLTSSADNSTAMQNAIIAAAALGAAVSIPACGTYEFQFPITQSGGSPHGYSFPNGMKIFAPGGYQCVRFQVSTGCEAARLPWIV